MRPWRRSDIVLFLASFPALACSSEPLGAEAGGGGPVAVETATLSLVFGPSGARQPTALAFHPATPGELWVTLREPATDAPCTDEVATGCAALIGKMAIVTGADGDGPTGVVKTDANGWHFLRRPSSLAFAEDGSFATCAEARTSNYEDEDADFNGPVRWSADKALFGAPAQGETGSTHIDMLHETPYCMGIASETGTIYWAFNGNAGALDRYDFHEPHPPGEDDHSDGEVWRYATGEVSRLPGVPSHLVYDRDNDELYVADTGNARVIALDANSGVEGDPIVAYDPIATRIAMNGATLREVVPPGTLGAPSGIALHDEKLFVSDHATGHVHVFDRDGRQLADIDTTLGERTVAGIALGPGGHIYVASLSTGEIHRIESPVPE